MTKNAWFSIHIMSAVVWIVIVARVHLNTVMGILYAEDLLISSGYLWCGTRITVRLLFLNLMTFSKDVRKSFCVVFNRTGSVPCVRAWGGPLDHHLYQASLVHRTTAHIRLSQRVVNSIWLDLTAVNQGYV